MRIIKRRQKELEKCEINANEIKRLEKRITVLEEYREKDKSQLHQLDTSLQVFINEMKNISQELQTVVTNFKEAIIRSTNAQEKELLSLKEKVIENEKKLEKLDAKVEQETVVANSDKWKKATSYIVTAILSAIVSLVLIKIGLS